MSSIETAASMIGPITSSVHEITVAAKLNSGTRRQTMPGARLRRTVARVLVAKAIRPRQTRPTPTAQASTPLVFENRSSDSGASASVPACDGR